MTTWFVANAGSDAASGTSSGTPFQTIAKVASVALAGDTILLNRGDRWFESLGIPHSSITVDAYGAAAAFDAMGYCTNAPILDQGAAVTGWSSYAGGVVVQNVQDSFTGTTGTLLSAHTPNIGTSWTQHVNSTGTAQLTASGTVRCTTASTRAQYYGQPLPTNADYFVQADVIFKSIVAGENGRVVARCSTTASTFYTGRLNSDGTCSITTAAAILVTGTPVTVTAGTTYTVKLVVQGSTLTLFVNGVQVATTTDSSITAAGAAGIQMSVGTPVSDTTNVQMDNFSTGPIDTGTPTNTYQATLASQPLIVDHNQSYCFLGNTMNTLADQQYYWYQGVLYFRNNAGLPNNTEVVVGARANGVSASALTGLVVQNIAVEHANQASYFFNGCASVTLASCFGQRSSYWNGALGQNGFIHIVGASNNPIVQNCFGRNIGADGIYFNTASAPQALWNTFHQIYEVVSNGISVDPATPANGVVIRGNVITYPSGAVGFNAGSNSSKGGIICFSDGALIERNFVAYGPVFGISLPCNSPTVRDNVLYHCGGGAYYTVGLGLNGGGGGIRFATNGGVNLAGHQVYRNLCLECPTGIWGFIDAGHSVTGLTIVNNAVVNISVAPATMTTAGANVATGYQVYLSSAGTGFGGTFENNLIYNFQGSGAALFFQTVSGSWTSDYNLWGPDAAGEFSWLGTIYATLAAFQAGASKDSHSINSTPTFSNKGYTPAAAPPILASDSLLAYRNGWRSPARDAGVLVGAVPPQWGAPDMGIEAVYGYWMEAV